MTQMITPTRFTFVALTVGLMLLSADRIAAQATRPFVPKAAGAYRGDAASVAEILEQLASNDPAQKQHALEAIRARMQTRGLTELRATWLRPLANAKMHKEVADLAMEGILAHAWDTRSVESVLQMRIKSLIALNQPQQALSEAKSLFNVATMLGTSEAILTVAECLNAAYPNDPAMFNKFREEQMAGAVPPSTQPGDPAAAPRKCTVLAGIKVDPRPWEQALKNLTGEDAQTLMARGNLLLLADRVAEARTIFERLYSLSSADITEASEALARCIKAEDGTIGRANAWVLSIRPKPPRP